MPSICKPAYRPDIDGLRAIAVLAVVFYHAGLPGFSGGYVGVDVFFVISGFLITQIVWSDLEGERFSLTNFYIRRVKRIFPALFAVLIVSSIAAFFLLMPGDLKLFGQSLNATVLFFSNFYWQKHENYFAGPAIDNPLLHTWSLAVEEQFYLVWPLTLLFLSRVIPGRRVPHVILFLALISLVLSEARLPDYQKDAFYFPWCRAWELLLGALLAVSPAYLREGRVPAGLGIAGIAAIALAVAFFEPSTKFPGLNAVLPCAGAALVIAAGSASNPVGRVLSLKPIRQIGLISYSLYLIHWPLFSFAHLYWNKPLTLGPSLALVLVSIFLAYMSWRFIENPFRRLRFSWPKVFGAAAAAMSALYLTGGLYDWSEGLRFRTSEQVLAAQTLGSASYVSQYCRRDVIPGLKSGRACLLGEDHGDAYDFILWGDSHAGHYIPAIATLALAHRLSGVVFTHPGCHPFLGETHTATLCHELSETVASWVMKHPVKVAILGGRWSNHFKDFQRFIKDPKPSQNTGGFAKTLAFLTSRGAQVSILDETPPFSQGIQLCVARALFYGRNTESCVVEPASRVLIWHKELDDYFAFLHKEYNFTVASGAAAICDERFCRARKGDDLLMLDDNHLSEAGSLAVMPYLKIPLLNPPLLTGAGNEQLPAGSEPAPTPGSAPL